VLYNVYGCELFSLNLIKCRREKGIECGSSVSPWSFYQIAGKGAASGWLAGLLAGERARARAICFMGARQLIGLPGLECKWQNV
jgi:hypothetical protein